MDKKKVNKEEKVGTDGLTKKERRALKVQAKQTDDNKAELKISQQNKESVPNVQDRLGDAPLNNCENNDNLSEKQKRKLEWEKRQAELGKPTEKKDTPDGLSKAELKAKRREIQEAQRIAKVQAEAEKNVDNTKTKVTEKSDNKAKETQPKHKSSEKQKKNVENRSLFHHLLTANSFKPIEEIYPLHAPGIHHAFIKFGILYASGGLHGSNDKTRQFLWAIGNLVADLEVEEGQQFARCLESALDKNVEFLAERKHVNFAMLNALKSFKAIMSQLDSTMPEEENKKKLVFHIDMFIQDQIVKAGIAISGKLQGKLFNGDVILVYGWSQLIFNILVDTYMKHNKNISVIIVDSRPSFDGQEMQKKVADLGIANKYVLLHGLCQVLPLATTVLLEADALMTNGCIVSKAGTAQIALMAQYNSVPVLVCCETYKFTDKEQTDGMVCNELGNPNALLENLGQKSPVSKEENSKVNVFNLLYNLIPSDLVTAVFTELAILPCNSVPAACKAAKLLNM